ncbi:MAG: extradiol ring-cleavage dioxygenase [Acidimicrobiia bacterium]
MGETLAVGLTHYPPLTWPDRHMADILRWTLGDPDIPAELRDPSGWPEPMAAEYGDDGGAAAAARHRDVLVADLRRLRHAIDDFRPDVVVVWGDDQYESFREECVPAFCVMALPDTKVQPWEKPFMGIPNFWEEPADTTFTVPGAPEIGKHVTGALLDAGFDVAYSYRSRDGEAFPHAFLNTLLFLDYDRKGFDIPMLPIAINCYGRHLVTRRGGLARFADAVPPERADPPSPSPARCAALGAEVARVLAASPWRTVLVASSSWSHAFLTDKTWRLHPDTDSDRRLYDALAASDFATWRETPLSAIEDAGQQEMLNWFCLLGAVEELGLSLEWSEFVETWVLNSNKCFAQWR